MKRILHSNPRTQKYLDRVCLAGTTSDTFAELGRLNEQQRKDNIVRRVAA